MKNGPRTKRLGPFLLPNFYSPAVSRTCDAVGWSELGFCVVYEQAFENVGRCLPQRRRERCCSSRPCLAGRRPQRERDPVG